MKTFTRILDHEADNAGWGLPELPMMLICIHRALVTAEVPGIRCTNLPDGGQRFETAYGTPVHTYLHDLKKRVRAGGELPSPRQVLTMFGVCCSSPLPCGAPPLPGCNAKTTTTQKTKPGV
jgi:hypothetical protein